MIEKKLSDISLNIRHFRLHLVHMNRGYVLSDKCKERIEKLHDIYAKELIKRGYEHHSSIK